MPSVFALDSRGCAHTSPSRCSTFPDDYRPMDPELVEILERIVPPIVTSYRGDQLD